MGRNLTMTVSDIYHLTYSLMISHVLIKESVHVYRVVIIKGRSPRKNSTVFVEYMAQVSAAVVSGRA